MRKLHTYLSSCIVDFVCQLFQFLQASLVDVHLGIKGPSIGRNGTITNCAQCHISPGHGNMVIYQVLVRQALIQHAFIGSRSDKNIF